MRAEAHLRRAVAPHALALAARCGAWSAAMARSPRVRALRYVWRAVAPHALALAARREV